MVIDGIGFKAKAASRIFKYHVALIYLCYCFCHKKKKIIYQKQLYWEVIFHQISRRCFFTLLKDLLQGFFI